MEWVHGRSRKQGSLTPSGGVLPHRQQLESLDAATCRTMMDVVARWNAFDEEMAAMKVRRGSTGSAPPGLMTWAQDHLARLDEQIRAAKRAKAEALASARQTLADLRASGAAVGGQARWPDRRRELLPRQSPNTKTRWPRWMTKWIGFKRSRLRRWDRCE